MCKLVKLSNDSDVMVADLKRDFILNIIDSARLCKDIKRIVLFGSALESRCHSASDIDIAIVGDISPARFNTSKGYLDFRRRVFEYNLNQEYDMLYFKGIEGDIASAGSVIYNRGM